MKDWIIYKNINVEGYKDIIDNILTEDMGIIHGIDNCKCGKKGKYFTVLGRVPSAELRGCSDVS